MFTVFALTKIVQWNWIINQLGYTIVKSVLFDYSKGLRITNKEKINSLTERLLAKRINKTKSERI